MTRHGDRFAVANCNHSVMAGSQIRSTHRTSVGTVAYCRCRCGAWLVLLDGQLLAIPGAATGAFASAAAGPS